MIKATVNRGKASSADSLGGRTLSFLSVFWVVITGRLLGNDMLPRDCPRIRSGRDGSQCNPAQTVWTVLNVACVPVRATELVSGALFRGRPGGNPSP